MNNKGVFSISLDFELHWGCLENKKVLDEPAKLYFSNTRAAIPKMLEIFKASELHVTWAIVGMLFNRNKTEWKSNLPNEIPPFINTSISAYEWVKQNGFINEEDPYHFAPQLIEQIKSTPFQEIGTHTYAHYFCLEKGQTKEHFRQDIKKAIEIAQLYNIEIKSLVFPRNQFTEDYLSVCVDFGITAVRSNPDIWYWKPATSASLIIKLFRTGDAYLNLFSAKPVNLNEINVSQLPLQLPATRLYRSWKPTFKIQNRFKLKRILNEMSNAAKNGYYYHLWWHPHNFGYNPVECLQELECIANHFKKLHNKYGFESQTMNETTQFLVSNQ